MINIDVLYIYVSLSCDNASKERQQISFLRYSHFILKQLSVDRVCYYIYIVHDKVFSPY